MPAPVEGGRTAGGDGPNAADVALEAKGVGALNGALRALLPLSSDPCLNDGTRLMLSPALSLVKTMGASRHWQGCTEVIVVKPR